MIVIQNITDIWQHLNGLKAFIFDLDDTLYSEKEYVKSGYAAVAKVLPNVEDAETKLWKAFEEKKFAIDDVLRSENIYSEELKQKCLEVYRFHQPSIHLYDEALEILTQLRKKGLIRLEPYEENQRSKQSFLTDTGRAFVEEHIMRMHRMEENAWKELSSEERSALIGLTKKISCLMQAELERSKINMV